VQVIGERLVTPSAIVFLLVKLRVKAPGTSSPPDTKSGDELDEKFLSTRGDAEELEGSGAGYAHAPYWPGVRLNH
jgi:translocation protein SEC63